MKSTMKKSNQIRIIAVAAAIAVISLTAISGNSKTEMGSNNKNENVIIKTADGNGMNMISKIAAEINKSLSNHGMIIRLTGINLPNHSN